MASFSSHNFHHLSFSIPPSVYVPSAMSSSKLLQEQETIMKSPSNFHFSSNCPNKMTQEVSQYSTFNLVNNSTNIHKHLLVQKAPENTYIEPSFPLLSLEKKTKKKRKNMNPKVVQDGKCKREEKSDTAVGKKKRKLIKEKIAPPTDYVHVRARRGQATDSHSLAERVRREKISERMKFLQSLVPGCDKMTGKIQVLDEIINYVQSLQNHVELLQMKIASLNPLLNDLEIATPASEEFYDIGTTLKCVPQTDPDQLIDTTIIREDWPKISTSTLLRQENHFNIISQDDGNYLWEMDDQVQSIVNAYEFENLYCSF